jgi:hypothetical protein
MEDRRIELEAQQPAGAPDVRHNRKVFLWFLVGIAAVGILFVGLAVLRPYKTGVVTRVGRISQYVVHSGKGRRRGGHKRYRSDVKVLVKGTDEKETVYYRVKDPSYIPQVGDEIQFSYSWLIGGCTPYPEYWAIWMGLILLALDGTVFVGYILVARKKKQGGSL